MYNQEFINIFGEMNIQNWLLMDLKNIKKNYLNLIETGITSKEETIKIIAFENYILKYSNQKKTKLEQTVMDDFLDFIIDLFSQKPYEVQNSLLLRTCNLPKVFKSDKYNTVLKIKNEIEAKAKIAMVKHANSTKLSTDEKKALMNFYINNLTNDNINLQNIIKNYIKTIINTSSSLTNEEYLFLGHFAIKYIVDIYNKENNKNISDYSLFLINNPNEKYYIKNYIFINLNEDISPLTFIKDVFHEAAHLIQSYNSQYDKESPEALEWIQNELFEIYKEENPINHKLLGIEKTAIIHSYECIKAFYTTYSNNNLININKMEKIETAHINFWNDYRTEKNQIIPKELYNVRNLNEIIYKHPRLLRKYPILNKIYEKNGTAKNLDVLLNQNGETKKIEKNIIYHDYIKMYILEDKLLKLNIKYYNNDVKANIISNLIFVLTKELENLKILINLCHKTAIDLSEKNILVIGNYHIAVIVKIIEYIRRNYDIIYELEKSGKLNLDYYNSYTINNTLEETKNIIFNETKPTILNNSLLSLLRVINKYFSQLKN